MSQWATPKGIYMCIHKEVLSVVAKKARQFNIVLIFDKL